MVVLEAGAVIALVGWFVAPNIKELMDWARYYAGSKYKWYTGLQEKLEKLAEDLEEISCLVGASGSAFVNDPARIGRLWRLNDAIHDAEELLDTFEYQILEVNLKKSHRDGKAPTDSSVDHGNQVTIGTEKSLDELNKLLERLDKLCKSSRDLFQISQHGVRRMSRPVRGPMPTKDKLFGYDDKYDDLLSKLSDGDAGVVAIIGHGGTGKTELARRAFNDEKVRAKFDLLIWVCVYGKFTETELLREIWNSAAGARPVGEMNVNSLQLELAKMVKSGENRRVKAKRARRYLLVLDDVCNDESAASALSRKKTWDEVLAPFKHHGGTGSRILMTTRAEICSTTLDAGSRIVLNGIDTLASTLLLKRTAFGHEDAELPRELQDAIDNNVGKLQGSPLVAEEVGCMLKGIRNRREWKQIMSRDHHKTASQAHLSSYQDLSPQLQRCFAFCSIFPNKWNFEPKKLIKMWIALGFVEGPSKSGGEITEEDVAWGYFDVLLQQSLFQKAKVKKRYVIHEHIHCMLRLVCPTYYLRIDRSCGLPGSARTVRHLSVTTGCLGQLNGYPDGLKQLRTLLVFRDDDGASSSTPAPLISATANAILKKFKGVRVLDFSDTCMTELPKSTGELQHLRYLGLPRTIRKLGDHATKLLLLRFLNLSMEYIAQIAGIGSLQKLQGSVEFHAGKSKEGHAIGELEKLNSLSRTLSIKGLEKVLSKQEAESARLTKKVHLKDLKLEWKSRNLQQAERSAGSDSEVLEGLLPHPHLENLHIKGYVGMTSPSWLEDARVLKNLRSLHLRNCNQLQVLPLVGRLPLLKLLEIKGLPNIKNIDGTFCGRGAYFRSLERMVLDDMPKLEAWDAAVPADGAPILFPQLMDVKIIDCNRLSSLSGLLCCNSLMFLRVERCREVRATFSRSSFPSLEKLHLQECPSLEFRE